MVSLQKLEMACLEDHSDTMLYQINEESLEICNFHVFSIKKCPFRGSLHHTLKFYFKVCLTFIPQ